MEIGSGLGVEAPAAAAVGAGVGSSKVTPKPEMVSRPYTMKSFRSKLRKFEAAIRTLTLKDAGLTLEERKQYLTGERKKLYACLSVYLPVFLPVFLSACLSLIFEAAIGTPTLKDAGLTFEMRKHYLTGEKKNVS